MYHAAHLPGQRPASPSTASSRRLRNSVGKTARRASACESESINSSVQSRSACVKGWILGSFVVLAGCAVSGGRNGNRRRVRGGNRDPLATNDVERAATSTAVACQIAIVFKNDDRRRRTGTLSGGAGHKCGVQRVREASLDHQQADPGQQSYRQISSPACARVLHHNPSEDPMRR